MNSNNVVTFKNSRIEAPSKDPDSSAAQLRSSYCDEMANELFGIVMRIIERSGHMDNVDTSDEGFLMNYNQDSLWSKRHYIQFFVY